uniref:Fatty-acid amide hydrolase 1 n=1 Tax=Nothoprocta perdicaria TaxID=30464 RepID=A0A8C6ZU47_NOTPE
MICEKVKQFLTEFGDNPSCVPILVCSSTAALVALTWAVRKLMKRKFVRAKYHEEALEQMEKTVQQFKEENPDVQTSHILSLPLAELVEKLKEGSLSPESVLYSYIEKALEVNKEVNCVTAFIPSCLQHIQEMRNRKKGLLYGVPISIKDHVVCKVFSLFLKLSVPEQEESVLMRVLRSQGAIPFVKTNTAQCVINYDCSNDIYGQTLNPLNHKKSPGGCSGGEGALIAGGGSILGFGLDIGGSIRLLSSFCGLCGLKPTSDRLSLAEEQVFGVVGPIARDVDSLALCMRALLCEDMFCLDPTVPPIPFNMEVFSSPTPLRIGFYSLDGYFLLPPCVTRAVYETRLLLEEAGHTVVWLVCTSLHHSHHLWSWQSTTSSQEKRRLVHPGIRNNLLTLCGQVYRWEFITRWKNLDLDVVLCPVLGPALHRLPGFLTLSPSFPDALSSTMLYNILNFPVGVVPVTKVTEADEEQLQLYSGYLDEPWDKGLRKVRRTAVGLPVAVQCVALPWQEELCLRFMKEVERLTCEKKQRSDDSGSSPVQSHGLNETSLGEDSVAWQPLKLSCTLPEVSHTISKAEACPTVHRTALRIIIADDQKDDLQAAVLQPDMESDGQTASFQPLTSTPVKQSDVKMLSPEPDVATLASWSDEENEGPVLIRPPDKKGDLQPHEAKPDAQTQASQKDGERDTQTGESELDNADTGILEG